MHCSIQSIDPRAYLLICWGGGAENEVKPRSVTMALTSHSMEMTKKLRYFAEANPNKRAPINCDEFPGYMDEATCLCVLVGPHSTSASVNEEPPSSSSLSSSSVSAQDIL